MTISEFFDNYNVYYFRKNNAFWSFKPIFGLLIGFRISRMFRIMINLSLEDDLHLTSPEYSASRTVRHGRDQSFSVPVRKNYGSSQKKNLVLVSRLVIHLLLENSIWFSSRVNKFETACWYTKIRITSNILLLGGSLLYFNWLILRLFYTLCVRNLCCLR